MRGEIRRQRINRQIGKIAVQFAGLGQQKIRGNIHRDISAKCPLFQQNAGFCGRARAEFNEGGVLRNKSADRGCVIAQDAKLGAGRIIFRQPGDLLEQFGAARIIKILWRKLFSARAQAVQNILGKTLMGEGISRGRCL